MIKKFTLVALLILANLFVFKQLSAQCGWSGSSGITYPAIPCGSFGSNLSVGSGTYTFFTAYNGSSYTVSTCGSSFNTQLTIYDANPAWTARAFNDDNGPDCAGTAASLTWTASYTGDHIAIVNRSNCQQHDFTGTSAILKFRENPPVAPASNPSGAGTFCVGAGVTLNRVSTPPTGLTYHWVNAPGSTTSLGTGATYNPSTASVGTFTYYVRPQSGSGCWGTASAGVSITIVADPAAPTATKSPNVTTVCAGQILSLTGVTDNGGGTGTCNIEYSINGGAYSTTPASFAATVGTNTIAIRKNCNGSGCDLSSVSTYSWTVVADPAAPTATKSPNVATVCAGQTLTLTGVTDNGGGTGTCNIEYSINGGAYSTTPASFAATVGTNTIAIRKNCNGSGCDLSSVSTYSWTVVADPAAPTATKSPNVATVCAGQTLTLTGVTDNGGGTGTCNIEYSINGGAYSTTPASFAATVGTNTIDIRKNCNGSGCDISSVSSYSWTVVADPAAPTATKSPNVATVCAGQTLTLTGVTDNGGGTGTCNIEYSINGGAYSTTPASFAATVGTNTIDIRKNCNGSGCDISSVSTYSWTVVADPAAPTATKSPNVATVCAGQTLTLTGVTDNGGGTGTCNIEYSINGGAYSTTPASFAATVGTNTIDIRKNCNGSGCDISSVSTYSWTVVADPAAPTATKSPNVATVCAGQTLTLTGVTDNGGGTGTCNIEYSINGGAYSTTPASFAATVGTNTIDIRKNCNGSGCDISSVSSYSWTVNPVPAAFTVNQITSNPLCFRGTSQIDVPSSNATLSYQLRDNTTNVGSAQTGTGGTLTFFTNGLTLTNANYNVLATNISTSCSTAVSVGSITVDVLPAGYANNSDARVCYVHSNDYVEFRSANGIMLGINSNGQNLGNVTVTEYAGSPVDVQACGTYQPWYVTAALGRHWAVEPQFQPVSPVDVRLYFDNSDYTALQTVANANANPTDNVTALGSLDLSKYSNPGNPSVVNGVFTDNCGPGTYSMVYGPSATGAITSLSDFGGFSATGRYSQYNFTGFSELWLSGTDNVSPLPIELTSFVASCDNGQVRLDWSTATEINNEIFIIDRSADLQTWEEVLTAPGSGSTNQPMSYFGIDDRPIQGLSYYRLTQRDYDGASETFEPVSITCYSDENGNTMMVYPNPATDRYTVSINMASEISNASLELTNINGSRVMQSNINLVKGNNSFTYDTVQLTPGTYIIYVRGDNLELKPIKLIIK